MYYNHPVKLKIKKSMKKHLMYFKPASKVFAIPEFFNINSQIRPLLLHCGLVENQPEM